jgi:hypothetical protein
MLAGCGGSTTTGDGNGTRTPDETPSSTPDPSVASEFGTVVNVAEETGGRDVSSAISSLAGDDTLLYFPPGRYRLEDTVELFEFDNLGLLGRDATLVPPEGATETLLDIGRPDRARGLLLAGLQFDIRAPNTGPRPFSVLVDDDVVVRDITVGGYQDAGDAMLRVDVTDPDGSGVVERLSVPDGAMASTGATGLLVGEENRGLVRFVDCHIEGFPDNGLYAQPPNGSIEVQGGLFANCDVASLRVGNNSTVRGAQVRVDRVPDGFGNMRGIRLREGRNVLVEDCTVEMLEVSESDGALTVGHWLESATVRNTTIRIDTDGVNAIQVKDPEDDTPADGPIRFEGINIDGSAGERATVEVSERTNCRFDRATIRQTGGRRDGLLFNQSRGAVRNSLIDVSGEPIVLSNGAAIDRVNVRVPDTRIGF